MNSDKLTVAALPVDIAFGQVETNLAAARKAAAQASADILVLPELFSTGYTTAPAAMHALAAEAAAPSLETVRGIAADTGSAVAGSFASADHTNRAFLVQPDGSTTFYDKHHLFTLGREQRVFRVLRPAPPRMDAQPRLRLRHHAAACQLAAGARLRP